ncbi:hypothetical protein BT96DRAFT_957662 [Gymnopus androsaceus JB14]|uniref:PHP domain-like protein n=1 Tax=Gymnopus androsaceus JB14 TaxID=1447944 RepID=A0A6A4HL14_9AGAR|nr:hypothetical protein BT96DRAFT_957662 [Gymnopus androsaceus JB14]
MSQDDCQIRQCRNQLSTNSSSSASKKGKGKQPQTSNSPQFTAAQLRYTVVCFNQTVQKKVDPKVHVNTLNELLERLKPRQGIIFLKRLSVILDEDSEKGFGLINANMSYFNSYDILSLFTVGALGGESDSVLIEAGAAEANGGNAKRNWWTAARELVRVTKGKGLIVSGGVVAQADIRAPRDVANLISLLGLPQDGAHAACTSTPKSLILRAQTRKTYRAVFSEPELVIPKGYNAPQLPPPKESTQITTSALQPSAPPIGGQKKRPREGKRRRRVNSGTIRYWGCRNRPN